MLFALGGAEEGRKKADKVHILLWAKANQSDNIAQQVLSFSSLPVVVQILMEIYTAKSF